MLADKYNQIVTALMNVKTFVNQPLTCNSINICQWLVKDDNKDHCSFYIRKAPREHLAFKKPLHVLLEIYKETQSDVGYYVQALLLSHIEMDKDLNFVGVNFIKGSDHITAVTVLEIEGTNHEFHLRVAK